MAMPWHRGGNAVAMPPLRQLQLQRGLSTRQDSSKEKEGTMLTAERLRKLIDYNQETGVFVWRKRFEGRVQWNGRFANKIAGSIDPDTGYWRIRIDDRLYYSHRLAFLYVIGRWPHHQVDHKNLDRRDCRWENLREATHSQNGLNKRLDPRNSSGFRGVSLDKKSGRWVAEVKINDRRYRKWGFKTPELAYAYCNEIMQKNSGGFAYGVT